MKTNTMKKEKKPFKDTKLFQTIKRVAPQVLDTVTDVAATIYPPLGIVNTLVDGALAATKKKGVVSSEIASELLVAKNDYELEMTTYLELEVRDRESARNRQIKMAELGKVDWMMPLTGITGLGVFVYVVWAVITGALEESPIAHMMIGLVEGVALSIFMFYYGTSKGSKDKDKN